MEQNEDRSFSELSEAEKVARIEAMGEEGSVFENPADEIDTPDIEPILDEGPDDPAEEYDPNPDNAQYGAVQAAGKLGKDEKLTAEAVADATAWFMSDDPEEQVAHRRLKINVSTDPDKVMFIEWIVKALPRERITAIREEAASTAEGRRRGRETGFANDGVTANTKIAAEGTIYPNLRDKKVRGNFADPADAMKYRFRNKPGLIDQIAGHVIEVGGYSDEDVKELTAAKN